MKTPEEISKQIVEVVRNILGCNSDTVEDLIAQAIKAERERAQTRIKALREALQSLRGMCLGAPELAENPLYILPIVEQALAADEVTE